MCSLPVLLGGVVEVEVAPDGVVEVGLGVDSEALVFAAPVPVSVVLVNSAQVL
jgi:hypothetical protein